MPQLLELEELRPGRYRVVTPDVPPEGRDVVFGGQLLAQMIMASDKACGGSKDVKSINTIFARAGSYSGEPIELEISSMQAGRTWASDTVTAWQGERLLSRSLVLLSVDDPDLIRHEVAMPAVPGPESFTPDSGTVYPGAEMRSMPAELKGPMGVPAWYFWQRYPESFDSPAVNQAIVSWGTDGFIIGLNIEPHHDVIRISDAHRTISTGVIGHTVNFHERMDVSQWLLFAHEGTYAGRGRVHGRGLVFTEDGRLVATFSQDSMVRAVEGDLDPRRSM
jgi:acyl-CoA thioesterase